MTHLLPVNFDYVGATAAPFAAVVVGRGTRLQTAQPWHPQIQLWQATRARQQ